ncbi:hypothetical protein HYH03_016949 [Edaphochlamys debaryana]|uniref:Uncharacterized protein n=1 Tax=Edaphochlamys debaryana TaxID=47281 RepID=A0A835XIT0_9CHLO|nr:hypothetical protein HYH03_016949 [Edaphochlamys debaryana]|eukprot:KAG2484214.1 hypothetical protein HYH03_016949 [Edaphochlamys debaryana]
MPEGASAAASFLALASLQTGRLLLPAASPRAAAAGSGPTAETGVWSAQRAGWWRLAVQMLVYGMNGSLQVQGELLRQLYDMMAEALVGVWPPERRLDLDALSAEPPPEVAAALAGGLLRGLAMIFALVDGTLDPFYRLAVTELLAACDRISPGPGPGPGPAGGGLALVLVPAYGERAEAQSVLEGLGVMAGLTGPPHSGPHPTVAVVKRAAAGFLGTVGGALRRCRRLAEAGPPAQGDGSHRQGPRRQPPGGVLCGPSCLRHFQRPCR